MPWDTNSGLTKEEHSLAVRRAASRRWKKANADRNTKHTRDWRARNPSYDRDYAQRYREAHPDANAARCAARRALVRQATPPWADRKALRRVYKLAAVLGLDVDHIHPLKGKNFCGLHVPWNLQMISSTENKRKQNKLPAMYDLSLDKYTEP